MFRSEGFRCVVNRAVGFGLNIICRSRGRLVPSRNDRRSGGRFHRFARWSPFGLDAGDQDFQLFPVLIDALWIGNYLSLETAVECRPGGFIYPPARLRARYAGLVQGSANCRFHAGQKSVSVPRGLAAARPGLSRPVVNSGATKSGLGGTTPHGHHPSLPSVTLCVSANPEKLKLVLDCSLIRLWSGKSKSSLFRLGLLCYGN